MANVELVLITSYFLRLRNCLIVGMSIGKKKERKLGCGIAQLVDCPAFGHEGLQFESWQGQYFKILPFFNLGQITISDVRLPFSL